MLLDLGVIKESQATEWSQEYKGSKKLTWTDEAIEAFHYCRVAVSNCQELYFLEDTATPILQTDASDYGIGGYLYMIVNHQVRVIRYVTYVTYLCDISI